MAFAYCPDCSTRIFLGRKPWVGQPVTCDYCDAELEVVRVNPVELDWVDELAAEDPEEEWELEFEET